MSCRRRKNQTRFVQWLIHNLWVFTYLHDTVSLKPLYVHTYKGSDFRPQNRNNKSAHINDKVWIESSFDSFLPYFFIAKNIIYCWEQSIKVSFPENEHQTQPSLHPDCPVTVVSIRKSNPWYNIIYHILRQNWITQSATQPSPPLLLTLYLSYVYHRGDNLS